MYDTCRCKIVDQEAGFLAEALCTRAEARAPFLALLRDDVEIRDQLLDDPKVRALLMESDDIALRSPYLVFYVEARHYLGKRGISSRDIADYVSDVVIAYLYSPKWSEQECPWQSPYEYFARISYQIASTQDPNKSRYLRVHLSNYVLFTAGMLQAVLHHRSLRGEPPPAYYANAGATLLRGALQQHCSALLEAVAEAYFDILLGLQELSEGSTLIQQPRLGSPADTPTWS